MNRPLQRSGGAAIPEPTIHRCPAAVDLLSIGDPFFDMPLIDEKNFKWEGGYWKQIKLQQQHQQLQEPRQQRQRRRLSLNDAKAYKWEQNCNNCDHRQQRRRLSLSDAAKLSFSNSKCEHQQPHKRRQRRRSSIGDVRTFKRELQKVMEQPLEEAEETPRQRLTPTPMAVNVGNEASEENSYQEQIRCLTPRRWESTGVTNHDWTKDKSSNCESISQQASSLE